MSAGDSNYKVGPGKPPLHTRFQKGRSGNPSGKPGPAKLARRRFQRALQAALESETLDLKDARPRVSLDVMARRLTLDAVGGNTGAMKLILSELEKEVAREEPELAGGSTMEGAGEESGEEGADDPPPLADYGRWLKENPGQ